MSKRLCFRHHLLCIGIIAQREDRHQTTMNDVKRKCRLTSDQRGTSQSLDQRVWVVFQDTERQSHSETHREKETETEKSGEIELGKRGQGHLRWLEDQERNLLQLRLERCVGPREPRIHCLMHPTCG